MSSGCVSHSNEDRLHGHVRGRASRASLRAACGVAVLLLLGVMGVAGCSGATGTGIKGTVTIGPSSPLATTSAPAGDTKPYETTLVITPAQGAHLKRPVE